ncbi:uncharacterized protein B0T15DRAFT_577696 [Chaetomium strumarium]|uniref:Uncharacterized protein n=1 Tax=Chaetomium strumarium TaxID=1170767 RepID=A0AAJ0LYR7_9PEZI|nr:hypothetical protein B0T15DRAFT_577696 [Chaetomium strumarium]
MEKVEETARRDVDFIIDVPGLIVPPELKTAISGFPNSSFSTPADAFYCGYSMPDGTAVSHQVDFIARDIIFSCGLRAPPANKGAIDGKNAKVLLDIGPTPLTLTLQQQAIVEDRIEDVMDYFQDRPRSWWRERLGLPEEGGEINGAEEEDRHEHDHEQHNDNEDRNGNNEESSEEFDSLETPDGSNGRSRHILMYPCHLTSPYQSGCLGHSSPDY